MLTVLLTTIGFAYWQMKDHAVGAFVALYCLSESPSFLTMVTAGSAYFRHRARES